MEGLLGTPYGLSASWDNGWIIDGGVLEYRFTETETPYLLFSSPAYIRDPLDFLEASNLPHLPSLASVNLYLELKGGVRSAARVEEAGIESQTFHLASGVSVTVYSGWGPKHAPYLAGLAISLSNANAADYVAALRDLAVPIPDQVVATIFGSEGSFAVLNNFALALIRGPLGETRLMIWRRIESPRSWCEHLRPDLERCSGS